MKKLLLFLSLTLLPLIAEEFQEVKELPAIPSLQIQKDIDKPPLDNTNNSEDEVSSTRDPFVPLMTPKSSGQLSNPPTLNFFRETQIILPSTARKLKKIAIDYQNLDGSISTIEKEIEGNIDWHFPLLLQQSVQDSKDDKLTEKSFMLGDIFQLQINGQKLILKTHLSLIRNFILASPMRLILDFKNPTKIAIDDSFVTDLPVITEAALQTHLDFYRIILNLDGQYNYSLQSHENGDLEIDFY
ncbi:MAG: AMIN domain-containing protein [Helicobacter sp.]|nr:AMIN domain-containing protein [Helicobacter sp.]